MCAAMGLWICHTWMDVEDLVVRLCTYVQSTTAQHGVQNRYYLYLDAEVGGCDAARRVFGGI